jgi:hypothetical protein
MRVGPASREELSRRCVLLQMRLEVEYSDRRDEIRGVSFQRARALWVQSGKGAVDGLGWCGFVLDDGGFRVAFVILRNCLMLSAKG